MRTIKIVLIVFFWMNIAMGFAQTKFYNVYSSGSFDAGEGICQLPDSSYLITGTTGAYSNSAQAFVMKVSKIGKQIWTKGFGGNEAENGRRIFYIKDTIYVFGRTNSFGNSFDYYFLKLDTLGNILLEKNIGTSEYDWLQDAIYIPRDSTFITYGFKQMNVGLGRTTVLQKLDRSGNVLWFNEVNMFPGAKLKNMHSFDDSTFVIVGNVFDSTISHYKGLLKIYNIEGSLKDSVTFHDGVNGDYCFNDVVVSGTDSTYLFLIGSKEHTVLDTTFSDSRTWRYITSTNTLDVMYGGIGDQYITSYELAATRNGDPTHVVLIERAIKSNFGTMTDGKWDEIFLDFGSDIFFYWTSTVTNQSKLGDDISHQIISTLDGGVIIVGQNEYWGDGVQNVTLLKIGPNGEAVLSFAHPVEESLLETNNLLKANPIEVYPNPTGHLLKVAIESLDRAEIYNLTGKKILETNFNTIDVSDLDKGIYVLKIFSNGMIHTTRFVKD